MLQSLLYYLKKKLNSTFKFVGKVFIISKTIRCIRAHYVEDLLFKQVHCQFFIILISHDTLGL